ncbi:MAG TPA: amidohydrolase family protein [Verrucomicrobiaceae bacterium]
MNTPALFSRDRRRFLAASVGAVLGAETLFDPAGMAAEDRKFIDAHVHVWTPDTEHYPLAPGSLKKDMIPASFTPEELFSQCRPQGVNRIVLIQMSFYKFDNRYLLDMMERHKGVFRGVAIVDEGSPELQAEMKSLAKRGVRGFRVYTSAAQAAAWGDGMRKMWTCAADEGLAMCLLADPESLPTVQKWCAQFPKTRVVIDHFARIGMKGPVKQSDADHLCRLAESPLTHVKTSAFYALGGKKAPYTDMGPLVRRLRDSFGAERLMWASDCPFQLQDGHTYADSIALIRDRLDFLTASDKEWMLRKTAEKVFFS